MVEEHEGLPVAGYKPQSDDSVVIVNDNKKLEERLIRRIEFFAGATDEFAGKPIYDQRSLAIARTKIEEAFMWFNRAIFQPGRVALPEDADA